MLVAAMMVVAVPGAALAAQPNALFFTTKAPMPLPLGGRAAVAVYDTTLHRERIWYFGGHDTRGNTSTYTDRVDIYDPALDQWTQPLIQLHWSMTFATAHVDPAAPGVVYLAGGQIGGGTPLIPANTLNPYIIKYDTNNPAGQSIIGSFSGPRSQSRILGIGPKMYLLGGNLPNVEEFDVVNFGLNPSVATIPLLRLPMGWVEGPMIHVAGGRDPANNYTGGHFMFDPANGILIPQTSLNIPRAGGNLAMLNDGRYYAAIGTHYLDVQAWDPGPGTWSTAGSLPTPRQSEPAVGIGVELFCAGGFQNTQLPALGVNEVGQLVAVDEVQNQDLPANGGTATIPLTGGPVYVTTPANSTQGQAVVAIIQPPAGAVHGFRFQGHVYDISSSSILPSGGQWQITIPYVGNAQYNNAPNPNQGGPVYPKVRHWTGTSWDTITTLGTFNPFPANYPGTPVPGYGSTDMVTKVVAGNPGSITFLTSSLSPFGLEGDPAPVPATSDWSLLLAAIAGLAIAAVALPHLRRVM
jgi:hypothetical protein